MKLINEHSKGGKVLIYERALVITVEISCFG
jgi:hypothetical protein